MKRCRYIFWIWGILNAPGILCLLLYLYTGTVLPQEDQIAVMVGLLIVSSLIGSLAALASLES
jgi:hypothetical protein